MFILYFALAAFAGGIVAAVMGWLGSGVAFDAKTFLASVLRSLIAAAAGAIAGAVAEPVTTKELIILLITGFVAGAGIDNLGNRFSKALAARSAKKQ